MPARAPTCSVVRRSTSKTRTSPSPAHDTMVGEFACGRNLAAKMLARWPVTIVSFRRRGCGDGVSGYPAPLTGHSSSSSSLSCSFVLSLALAFSFSFSFSLSLSSPSPRLGIRSHVDWMPVGGLRVSATQIQILDVRIQKIRGRSGEDRTISKPCNQSHAPLKFDSLLIIAPRKQNGPIVRPRQRVDAPTQSEARRRQTPDARTYPVWPSPSGPSSCTWSRRDHASPANAAGRGSGRAPPVKEERRGLRGWSLRVVIRKREGEERGR